MTGCTTTTTRTLPFEDEDRTLFLTLEERLRYFDGTPLPESKPERTTSGRLQRLLRLFRR